jgi:hypothetical protein
MEAGMTYEEAIEKMAKAFEEKAEYVAYELTNEEECIRAAAEAIGLREKMEALEPFAKFAAYFDEKAALRPNNDSDPVYGVATKQLGELEITVGDFRKAARAITGSAQ